MRFVRTAMPRGFAFLAEQALDGSLRQHRSRASKTLRLQAASLTNSPSISRAHAHAHDKVFSEKVSKYQRLQATNWFTSNCFLIKGSKVSAICQQSVSHPPYYPDSGGTRKEDETLAQKNEQPVGNACPGRGQYVPRPPGNRQTGVLTAETVCFNDFSWPLSALFVSRVDSVNIYL